MGQSLPLIFFFKRQTFNSFKADIDPKNIIFQSSRDSLLSRVEAQSSNTVIMSIILIRGINLEEKLPNIKVGLERLSKETHKRMLKSRIKANKLLN